MAHYEKVNVGIKSFYEVKTYSRLPIKYLNLFQSMNMSLYFTLFSESKGEKSNI